MRLRHTIRSRRSASQSTDGFSLLELVVAVTIMLILGVVGFVAYQHSTDNARQAAVDSAANEVLTAVISAANIPDGDPAREVEHYNKSSSEITANIATANAGGLTVRAETCDGYTGVARTTGNYTQVDTTEHNVFTYEWTGEAGFSTSVKKGCDGEVVATNLSTEPTYLSNNDGLGARWGTNNNLDLARSLVTINDHPQGITTARQSRLKQEGLEKGRDNFYSDHFMGGVPSDSQYSYMGAWIWANRDAEVVLGKRFPNSNSDLVPLPANTWKFVVFPKDTMAGVTMFFPGQEHPVDAADAIGRVTGVIVSDSKPPTEYFDGDTR